MKKEPERLEMDLKKFPDTPEYHERENYIDCHDDSCVYQVFWTNCVFRNLSGQRNHNLRTSGTFYFVGVDGTAQKFVSEKRIF